MPRRSSPRKPELHDRLTKVFLKAKMFALSRGQRLEPVRLMICPGMRKGLRGKARARAFMHVGHLGPLVVCAHPEAARLGDNYLYGLFFHEFGHVATGSGERDADRWVFERLGIPMEYKGPLMLEWIPASSLQKVKLVSTEASRMYI